MLFQLKLQPSLEFGKRSFFQFWCKYQQEWQPKSLIPSAVAYTGLNV